MEPGNGENMRRSEVVILVVFAFGFTAIGAVWRPAFGSYESVKAAIECTSYIATTLAAVVAIYALNAWKAQFNHAERFKSLKELKDAAKDLTAFRGYLLAVERRCVNLMATGGMPDENFEAAERAAREKLTSAITAYSRAWSTAVVFFSDEDERTFSGPANVFVTRAIEDPLKIITLYANSPGPENSVHFAFSVREITDSAKHLYASTVSELEGMLIQKFRQ